MYYNKKNSEIIKELNTDLNGLSQNEVDKRIIKYGPNIIPKKKKDSLIKIFFSEFKDPIVLLLLVTIVVSMVVHEYIDALAIFLIVLIDIVIGTYQENKANKTADSLSKLITIKTKVIRDGKIKYVESSELTIGDFVEISSGDKIPADLRIVEAHNLVVDESILTGESVGVNKNSEVLLSDNADISSQSNMLFSGTNVLMGRAKAFVVKIGMDTELGKIAKTLNETKEEKTPLTIRIEKFSRQISFIIIVIAIVLMILLISKNMSINEIFLAVVALSVSAMPEGLPLALTMALTIASNKMADKNVIVKKLNSVESLGSATVIASDKTGTLTVNEQTAKIILLPNNEKFEITGSGYDENGIVIGKNIDYAKEIGFLGTINNEAVIDNKQILGDSIDLAFLVLGKKLNINVDKVKVIKRIPYESENQYSAVFYEMDNEVYCTVKGSLEVVQRFCTSFNLVNDKNNNYLNKQNQTLAKEGYRVISIANGKIKRKNKYVIEDIRDLTFMGMVGFIDPIRKEAIASINKCQEAGIKVLMITGDHPLTAFKIGKDLKLTNDFDDVITGDEVDAVLKLGKNRFDNLIKKKKIFARVTPIQKLKIVESLKRQGEFVAVTGDGVNDAPALKSANIGIAMGSGTDIAKETADMIIIDDDFTSIVEGIKEGRVAYANIRKIILFLISCGLAEVMFFTLSILFNLPMPLVAIQLLWLNVVTDGIQDLALSFEKSENEIMKDKPRSASEPLFDIRLIKSIIISGISIGLIIFIVWYYLINYINMEIATARGYIMALMVFIQNIHVFNCRSERNSTFSISLSSNYLIVGGVIISIILQIIIMEVPYLSQLLKTTSIPIIHLFILLAIASSILIIMEFYKIIERGKNNEVL